MPAAGGCWLYDYGHCGSVAGRNVDCVRILLSRADLVGVLDAQGMSPLQEAHLLPVGVERSQIIELIEANQPSNSRVPLLDSFLTDGTCS